MTVAAKPMSGWQLECRVRRERLEAVEALLETFGAQSLTLAADDEARAFLEPSPGTEPDWPDLRVQALFPAEVDTVLLRAALTNALGAEPSFLPVPDRDWVRENRASFLPIHAGGSLWICPSWLPPPDPGAVNVVLDPGAAFGTGRHATTLLCLRWLAEHPPHGARVIDYGCGSGILAIAALKLGAREALGVEIDALARETARDNAARNGVAASFRVPDDGAAAGPAELVLANILADTLLELTDELTRLTRPGGRILLSGVLDTQAERVQSAYAADFGFRRFDSEGWSLLVGTKR